MRQRKHSFCFQRKSLAAAVLSAMASLAQALPQGGNITVGTGSLSESGSNLTVNQGTQKVVIDWQGFGIATGESVQFVQPGADAVALNRVLGNNSSEIYGSLSANGKVFLTNPNGILFGPTAQVDVGSLVASTLNISNVDFLAGNYVFSGDDGGAIINQGTLQAAEGGVIALLAPEVRNEGLILAKAGAIGIGAGTRVRLDLGEGFSLEVQENALSAVIENRQALRAASGVIILSATAKQSLLAGMINNTGVIEAGGVSNEGGRIRLTAGFQSLGGTIAADGRSGGAVAVKAHNVNQYGRITANGSAGDGGRIGLLADAIVQPDSASISANGARAGGSIYLQGRDSVFTSASLTADGGQLGGRVELRGDALMLAAASISATGATAGGHIKVGGDYQGRGRRQQATTTWVNAATTLDASATQNGDGGTVIVWSDANTAFAGTSRARGGAQGGNGGLIEVSGKGTLQFAGLGDAGAAQGSAGTLLLDPKNILITDVDIPALQVIPLVDPAATPGDEHGNAGSIELANGNIVQISTEDDFAATNAGAVYLYRQSDGALLSMLTGSSTDDRVGGDGVTQLTNGNFTVRSGSWDNGAATDAGAVTWGSATSGVSGVVSAGNSLVGSTTDDRIGNLGVAILGSGNYLVRSSAWDNGSAADTGAVTWGNGATGTSGEISADNSLVGSTTNDRIGADSLGGDGLFLLSNGNYVVLSPDWDNGSASDAGAATFGSGSAGITGTVGAGNSLVGSSAFDRVGGRVVDYADDPVIEVGDSNYVVGSSSWNNGAVVDAGAVTWGSGSTGVSGEISAANSLVGSQANDSVGGPDLFTGRSGLVALSNGNYLVSSSDWDSGAINGAGAVTFGNGNTGISGVVTAGNSLVGSSAGDNIGWTGGFLGGNGDVVELANGNFVLVNPGWDNGVVEDAGAVTWGSGSTGVSGVVGAGNSLVGSHTDDLLGNDGVTALGNGNYVVQSSQWDNGGITDAGAVTFGNGGTGTSGVVNAANSLVGSTAFDGVGGGFFTDIVELANGNYLVLSPDWDNGVAVNAGAVTWGSGTGGVSGVVSGANSLVGAQTGDQVGGGSAFRFPVGDIEDRVQGSVVALPNGNYVVASPLWDNGVVEDAGAATFGNGATGTTGVMGSGNSLVGTQADDRVGATVLGEFGDAFITGIVPLANGNYVVHSIDWDNGAATGAGAVTWGSGTTGVSGNVSAANSLVGGSSSDQVGHGGIITLANGNYVVDSPFWHNGAAANAGAITWGSGAGGVSGVVDGGNSLVGSSASDSFNQSIILLANGNYVVNSPFWDNGGAVDAGAVTWGSDLSGVAGAISADNAIVGTSTGDQVGSGGVTELANGHYVVNSPFWSNGATGAIEAGAVTWASADVPSAFDVDAGNSLVGTTTGDRVGFGGVTALNNGNYVVNSYLWNNGATGNVGAVTWGNGDGSTVGDVGSTNSLVGSLAQDRVGAGGVAGLGNGNYLVFSPDWQAGPGLPAAGAVTLASGVTGVTGEASASNSLLGQQSGDRIGSAGYTELANGDVVVRSPQFQNNTGRVELLRLGPGGYPLSGNLLFGAYANLNVTLNPAQISSILDTGTHLTLQANNDITVATAVVVDNPAGNGGDLTLQAGRNVRLGADIFTDNGDLTVVANERHDRGVIADEREAGTAGLSVGTGVSIDAGTGTVRLLMAGESNPGDESITLEENASVSAGRVVVLNFADNGGISLQDGSVLAATGSGLSLLLGGTNGGSFTTANGAAHAQTPNGFWLAFRRQEALIDFVLGDSDGVISSGQADSIP